MAKKIYNPDIIIDEQSDIEKDTVKIPEEQKKKKVQLSEDKEKSPSPFQELKIFSPIAGH